MNLSPVITNKKRPPQKRSTLANFHYRYANLNSNLNKTLNFKSGDLINMQESGNISLNSP